MKTNKINKTIKCGTLFNKESKPSSTSDISTTADEWFVNNVKVNTPDIPQLKEGDCVKIVFTFRATKNKGFCENCVIHKPRLCAKLHKLGKNADIALELLGSINNDMEG